MALNRLTGLFLATATLIALIAAPAHAERDMGDSTTADGWVLANGLRVVTRHIPGAGAVAIVVAYPSGRDDDPKGQEGLTALMAEIAFTARAGDLPARTHAELDSQRPIGWNVQTERQRTELAEMATPDQFPGVLHQVAQRMRGVHVTDEVVERARARLLERQGSSGAADVGAEMYVELGQLGAGWDHAAFQRWRSGEGLARLHAKEIGALIGTAYVPARGVLSLAGDFEGINLRAFIESEFGPIAAGTPRATVMPAPAAGGSSSAFARAGLDGPVGGIGIAAPALTDSLHPSFYLTALILGTHVTRMWPTGDGPIRSRFQYSVLDDPGVVRFYPPVIARNWSPENLQGQLNAVVQTFSTLSIVLDQMSLLRNAVEWMLGGPLPGPLAARIRTDPAVLYRLCSSAATRELWGGEPFWSEYRRRFDPARNAGDERWIEFMTDPARSISVIYAP